MIILLPVYRKSFEKYFRNKRAGEHQICIGGKNMKYRVVIEQDEDGIFIVECPALPGCISDGRTHEEAIKNIREAIEAYIESLRKHNEPIPPPIYEEIVEVEGFYALMDRIL
jgi:antitoxin HicB